jgi:hypothetical protein
MGCGVCRIDGARLLPHDNIPDPGTGLKGFAW